MTKENQKTKELALRADFGTVYCKASGNQLMRPIKASIKLKESRGHLYSFGNKTYIAGPGYIVLNKVASISLVTPRTVVVDGREELNPYVERNKKTRAIEAVAARKIGIGYSPMGNITVIDKTLYYNIYTYLIQSIQSKMKKDNRQKKCAFIGTVDDKPGESWVFFETVSPLGIWANYKDEKIIECLEEHTRMQRFGERIAQKICERNILRDHPAIGVARVPAENGDAMVTVYGWRHELGPSDLRNVMAQAEAGAEEIEVKKETIAPELHEVKEAVEEEAAVEESESPATATEPPADWEPGKKLFKEEENADRTDE